MTEKNSGNIKDRNFEFYKYLGLQKIVCKNLMIK